MLNQITSILDTHLVANWRKALRLRIIQLHLAITAIGAVVYNMAKAYPSMAQDVVSKLPPELLHPAVVNLALLVWALIGAYARLVPQPNVAPAPPVAPPAPPPPGA